MGLLGTSATLFADFSLFIEALILGGFLLGLKYARDKRTNEHYKIMTAAFLLNVLFVGAYMIRSLIKGGSTGFVGPQTIKDFVYLPTVIVHGIASLLAFLFAGVTVYYGYTRSTLKKKRVFTDPGHRSRHRILGVITVSTWSLSFISGVFVYILLYVLY